MNVDNAPPPRPKMKLGPEDHVLETGLDHGLLLRPLRRVVGNRALGCGRPERAHQDEPPDARLLCGRDEVLRSLRHHALEVLGAALDDRDQVDHVSAAGRGRVQALGRR